MKKTNKKEINKLVENLKPRVKIPRGFGLYSPEMQIVWLRSNQKDIK